MPAVTRVLETALYVADVERSTRFYQDLFGFELLFAEERLHALNVAGQNALLLFKKNASTQPSVSSGGTIPAHDGHGALHMAFAIPGGDLQAWRDKLAECDIPIESEVHPERGGTSLYFRDPDNHLIELATPGIWDIY